MSTTFTSEVASANTLEEQVGTNGFKVDRAICGSRTFIIALKFVIKDRKEESKELMPSHERLLYSDSSYSYTIRSAVMI